jgi:hypothetical protein
MAAAQTDRGAGPTIHARAFGIDIESTFEIPCLPRAAETSEATTHVALMPAQMLARAWRGSNGVTVIDRRMVDGRRFMTIEYDATLGFRIWASRFGQHIVSSDGLRISSALPAVPAWRWQRLLFAQVLPLAAALRGRAPFHASAVVFDDDAIGFVAASGTGKTSLAAHLVAEGADFMTDDVLSLEFDGRRVLAHPGPSMTSVAQEQLATMTVEGRARLGQRIGREADKTHFKPSVVSKPSPLAALFFLHRESNGANFRIERMRSPDPRTLLASTFIPYTRSPGHLLSHLDTCATIAREVPVFTMRIPPGVPADDAAAAVRDRLAVR